jgi:hypothetical protein
MSRRLSSRVSRNPPWLWLCTMLFIL